MGTQHKDLSGSDLHEPKGVASASNKTVYVANGSGSGAWSAYLATDLDTTGVTSGHYLYNNSGTIAGIAVNNANLVYLTYRFADISSSATAHYVVAPIAGTIDAIWTVINNTVSADTVLSFDIEGTGLTSGDITIAASGSAAGVRDSSTPTGNNSISAGQALRVISDGATVTTCEATITVRMDVS